MEIGQEDLFCSALCIFCCSDSFSRLSVGIRSLYLFLHEDVGWMRWCVRSLWVYGEILKLLVCFWGMRYGNGRLFCPGIKLNGIHLSKLIANKFNLHGARRVPFREMRCARVFTTNTRKYTVLRVRMYTSDGVCVCVCVCLTCVCGMCGLNRRCAN